VAVPSPAWSEVLLATSRTICTPMFSNLSSSSISLATVTPSLLMQGTPYDLSRTTLRPLGPSGTYSIDGKKVTHKGDAQAITDRRRAVLVPQ